MWNLALWVMMVPTVEFWVRSAYMYVEVAEDGLQYPAVKDSLHDYAKGQHDTGVDELYPILQFHQDQFRPRE